MPPSVNFINVKHTNFSYERCFGNVHVTRKKLPKPMCVRKICTFNVDEIDTRYNVTAQLLRQQIYADLYDTQHRGYNIKVLRVTSSFVYMYIVKFGTVLLVKLFVQNHVPARVGKIDSRSLQVCVHIFTATPLLLLLRPKNTWLALRQLQESWICLCFCFECSIRQVVVYIFAQMADRAPFFGYFSTFNFFFEIFINVQQLISPCNVKLFAVIPTIKITLITLEPN